MGMGQLWRKGLCRRTKEERLIVLSDNDGMQD
jgi:hypothetical protein